MPVAELGGRTHRLGRMLCGGVHSLRKLIGALRGTDVTRVGSGNIGATNVRSLGPSWGLLVFVLDFLKGLVPVR